MHFRKVTTAFQPLLSKNEIENILPIMCNKIVSLERYFCTKLRQNCLETNDDVLISIWSEEGGQTKHSHGNIAIYQFSKENKLKDIFQSKA